MSKAILPQLMIGAKMLILTRKNNYFDESELSLIEVSMKNLSYILDAAEIHLLSKIDESYINDVKKSWLNKKIHLYSSLILLFNDFTIEAIMPGEIIFHNADIVKEDTLVWNFNLSEFSDENYKIIASSRIVNSNKLIAFIFMILLVAMIVIRKDLKNNLLFFCSSFY